VPLACLIIPYVSVSEYKPFAVLLALSVLTAFAIAVWRGKAYGIGREQIAQFSVWVVVAGFIGAHLGRLVYEPAFLRAVWAHPELLIRQYRGIASFGSLIGGLAGAMLYFRAHRMAAGERWRYLDVVGFALPFAFMIGRMGCAVVHDHPGLRSTSWLAVDYPSGARFDLGLIEVLFLFLVAGLFLVLDRYKHARGFYFALYFSLYGPFRALLDQLHVDPPRYFGWSVDEYGAALAILLALFTWFSILSVRVSETSSYEPAFALKS
jgi:phosphatidylglycerol:prolipoprotein diacylglycerol transferase